MKEGSKWNQSLRSLINWEAELNNKSASLGPYLGHRQEAGKKDHYQGGIGAAEETPLLGTHAVKEKMIQEEVLPL